MSKKSTSRVSKRPIASQTDWARIKAMRDSAIDTSDTPELMEADARDGVVRVAGKVVPRGKKRLTMYLDAALIEYFKAKAGARGYQTLINEALKEAIQRETLEDTLRRVVREETASYEVVKKRARHE